MQEKVDTGEQRERKRRFGAQGIRSLFKLMLAEGLDPRRAAAAVFIGVFFGVVPIYGFQTLVVLGLAALFRLNKALAFGGTFVNNPLLQPLLILGSLEIGHYLLKGEAWSLPPDGLTALAIRSQLSSLFLGSLVIGVLLAGPSAAAVYFFLRSRSSEDAGARRAGRDLLRSVRNLYRECPGSVRGFVTWKMRLDRIFVLLATEDLGDGPAVDLGCGYGMTLALAAQHQPGRVLSGCDLDPGRVRAAQSALGSLGAFVSVADVRSFEFSDAGLILIIDVLQYLDPAGQQALLKRCCSALRPGGKLIFRIHDTGRGLASGFSLGLDRILFLVTRAPARPAMLGPAEYRVVLEQAGLRIRMKRFINRLPLAHILFLCEKPEEVQPRTATTDNGDKTTAG